MTPWPLLLAELLNCLLPIAGMTLIILVPMMLFLAASEAEADE